MSNCTKNTEQPEKYRVNDKDGALVGSLDMIYHRDLKDFWLFQNYRINMCECKFRTYQEAELMLDFFGLALEEEVTDANN